MRITRGTLLKNARNLVAERLHTNRSLVCIYLTGSLINDKPLLGGVTDIDLIFVHEETLNKEREIVRLTDEVHFDIAHYSQKKFNHPRQLRTDPWLGSFLCKDPIVLHDTRHWFEFTQASVCAQFYQPENILNRAQPLIEGARQRWFNLSEGTHSCSPENILVYLKSLEYAANAISILSGPPLAERRFILEYPARTEAIRRPGLSSGLEDLFSSPSENAFEWGLFQSGWEEAFLTCGQTENTPAKLSSCRVAYYKQAIESLYPQYPAAALWICLHTWTLAASFLEKKTGTEEKEWRSFCQQMGLHVENMDARLEALDVYLDNIEEVLDLWAEENGLPPLSER
jgi:hypothetical protein